MELTGEELRLLQLNCLELLVEFDRICRKYDIKYAISAGTLLGAVRHKGFIPWDDDIDISITRAEYNRFYEVAKKELDGNRFFLQEYRTDPYYRWGWPKLRLLGTDYVREGQEHLKYKRGVFVDLMVRDNMPDGKLARKIHNRFCFVIRKTLYSELGRTEADSWGLRILYSFLYLFPRNWVMGVYNTVARVLNRKNKERMRTMAFETPYGIPSSIHDDYIEIEFEGMSFLTHRDYDFYLKATYGDYMVAPPKEKQCGNALCSYLQLKPIALEEIQEQYRLGRM